MVDYIFDRIEAVLSVAGLVVVTVLVVVLLAALFGGAACYQLCTTDTATITVKGKERVTTGDGETITSRYLVFTEHETFENTDAIWHWKFDSSDVYGQLEEGKTYTVKVYGWRVPILSWYRNIVSVAQ